MKNQQRPDDGSPSLQLESIEGGRWTWRYVEPSAGLELHSNETFSSRKAAMDWARRAYPDVPFAGEQDQGESESEGTPA